MKKECQKQSGLDILLRGIIKENPVLVLVLGTCPSMATSTSVSTAVGMGLAATMVLLCSNMLISLLRKVIPDTVRIPCYIVVIAGFVTIVDLLLQAFLPDLSESLGLFIPLIVVNCIILGRAESFASKNSVAASAIDGIAQGLGYTIILVVMCVVREFLGGGTFGAGVISAKGIQILPSGIPALGMILPVGGFLTLAVVIAAMQYFLNRPKKDETSEEVSK